MKRVSVLVIAVLLLSLCYANNDFTSSTAKLQYQQFAKTSQNSVQLILTTQKREEVPAKAELSEYNFSKNFALPYQDVELKIHQITYDEIDENGSFIKSNTTQMNDFVKLTNKFTFRELNGFTLVFNPLIRSENHIFYMKSAEIEVVGKGVENFVNEVSEAFLPLYKALVVNYDDCYLTQLPIKRPAMLIISHNSLAIKLVEYLKWKKSCGYEVSVITKETIGTNPTTNQIKQAITDFYNQAENKPEFLLLLGDSNAGCYFQIPTFTVTSPINTNDASDHPYSTIVGDDYFPELLVGRMCIDTDQELENILSKTIRYEKFLSPNTNGWQTRALVVAGNYADGALTPTTPVDMSRWIYHKLKDDGYTQVDTVFYPPLTTQGTEQIVNKLSAGAQYVTYRGWGSANGWAFPEFYRNHLELTNNGGKLAVVFSIVCGTGDYNHTTYDPCFGEYWMKKGTTTNPDGAVAFVGPTYLHTSTHLNNSISSGMIAGIFDEGIRIFGSSVMRGKIELYNNNPNDLANGEIVDFYFKTYNMLCDPSLNLWKLEPHTMTCDLPNEVDQSTNSLEISVPAINQGVVTSTKDNLTYTYAKIVNGYALLPIDNSQTGNIKITITSRNFLPITKTINVTQNNNIGIVGYEISNGSLYSGSTSTITLSVKNFKTEAITNASAVVSSNSSYITLPNSNLTIGNMAANETKTVNFDVNTLTSCPNNADIQFNLLFSPTQNNAKFSTIAGGLYFSVESVTIPSSANIINPGETKSVRVAIKNISQVTANNTQCVIHPMNTAVSVDENPISIGSINPDNTQNIDFDLTVQTDCFVGREVKFYATFTTEDGIVTHNYFTMTIGVVGTNAPTGPDNYGYFAYDHTDTAYDQAPVYSWVEIDPDNGGSGIQTLLGDDISFITDLPTFKYYGQNYNRVTICSNGWISLGESDDHDFRNWIIPSSLGPNAMIAPYFDDLKGLYNPSTVPVSWAPMHVCYYNDTANNRFIVEWNETYSAFNNTSLEKFQVILYPNSTRDGDIVFQYHTIDNPAASNNFATVGIENFFSTDGICYSYANIYPPSALPLQANLAIKYTTIAPDDFVANHDNTQIIKKQNLYQNYPNPFNPITNIKFDLAENSLVKIQIFNVKGQKVKTITNMNYIKGTHKVTWNGKDDNQQEVSSGIYFYKLETNNSSQMKKMILMK